MISPHRAKFHKGAEALDFHAAEVQVLEHHDDSVNPGGPFLVDEAFNPLKRGWNKARWSRWACVGGQASAGEQGRWGRRRGRESAAAHVSDPAESQSAASPLLLPDDLVLMTVCHSNVASFLTSAFDLLCWSRVAVYHYVTKSREDFEVKTQRGGGAGITRDMTYFAKVSPGHTAWI